MLDGNSDLMLFALTGVIALCIGALIYVFAYPYLSGEKQTEKRIQEVSEAKTARTSRRAKDDEINNRRKAVADTLRDIDERQKAKEKVTLRLRLQRAGLDVTPKTFWIASAICGVATGFFVWLSSPGMHPGIPLAAAFVGAFGLPRWIVGKMIARRQKKFLAEFANAIDVIVRGVKSGLPLNECLKIISQESGEPVGPEFRQIIEGLKVGVTLEDGLNRMYERMPVAEVNFFQIVLVIQQKTGGNLSEALGNLSGVLRDRKRLQGKIQALSSEAKASAGIIGSLPVVVMGLVYATTPEYIALLFTERFGNFLLACCAIWMSLGIFVMKKMISFKY